jgi:hypothetical protein
VERELRIIEKKEVNEFCREQGRARRYPPGIRDTHATAQSMYAQEEIGHGVRQGNASAISNRFNTL